MLPVTLASADAKASSEFCEDCLPHSFSTMVCLSLEAIDITAALARCAMSRTGELDAVAVLASAVLASAVLASVSLASVSLASASFGAVANASRVAGVDTFGFAASAGFGAWAAFGVSAGGKASASLVASTGLGSTDLGGSPCGDAAANRSLNISEFATFSGAGITRDCCGSDANISLKAGRTAGAATTVGFLTADASKAALFTDG